MTAGYVNETAVRGVVYSTKAVVNEEPALKMRGHPHAPAKAQTQTLTRFAEQIGSTGGSK